jgi:hypothetical protein
MADGLPTWKSGGKNLRCKHSSSDKVLLLLSYPTLFPPIRQVLLQTRFDPVTAMKITIHRPCE